MEQDEQKPIEGEVVDEKTPDNKKQERKVVYILAYLIGILFFLPIILYKDGEARRRGNEAFVLFLFSIAGNLVFGLLTMLSGVVGMIFVALSAAYSALILVLSIFGIVNVVNEKDEPLPIIGKIKIIK